jgi:GntR family transcriptional repressor for pyruvate dehydrogenase complex
MVFKKINKNSASDLVFDQISSSIESEKIKPGERLPAEKDLASTFGVGRSSVREAIRTLVSKGYLNVFQGKGTFVKNRLPSPSDVTEVMEKAIRAGALFDLMETREILECRSAELAATRANKSQVEKMKSATKLLKKSTVNTQKYIEADWDFHMAIAEATNNSVIVDVMQLLINKIHHYNAEFLATSSRINNEAISSAEAVIQHVLEKNSTEAAKAMRYHLQLVDIEIKQMIGTDKKAPPMRTAKTKPTKPMHH